MDLLNQAIVPQPSRKIYSLTRLGDGRVCAATDKGFSVWQMINLPPLTSASSPVNGNQTSVGELVVTGT